MNNASVENFDIYMGKIKEVKEGLRAEKRKGFDSFCESLNPSTTYESIYKGVKNFKKKFK